MPLREHEFIVDHDRRFTIGAVLPSGIDAVLPSVRQLMQRAFAEGAEALHVVIEVPKSSFVLKESGDMEVLEG